MSESMKVAASFQEIPIAALRESKWNPRRHYDDATLQELAASIREKGVIEPIVVRPNGTGATFEIVAGSRRFRASKLAEQATVPAIVRQLDDVAALELAVIENQQRDDVHPLDEAEGYAALLKADRGYNASIVAAKVGKSESYVYRRLKLLDLVAEVKRAFEHDRLTVAHAERLARLTPVLQREAFEQELYHPFYRFTAEEETKPKTERLPDRNALRPLAELDAFIRRHSAIQPAAPETQHYFPEIAEASAAVEDLPDEPGDGVPPARLLELSDSHFVRIDLRLPKGAPVPLSVTKWHAIKGPKDRCAHVERGAIVHGGPPRVLEVCATKGCPKHFPIAKKKPTRQGTTKAQAAPAKPQWEIEQEKRDAARKAWEAFWPHVAPALVGHTAKTKFSAALVRAALDGGRYATHWSELASLKRVEQSFGLTLTEDNAAQVLLLATVHTNARDTFLRSVKPFGFNLGHIEQRLKADQQAAPAKGPKAAGKKGGKKR